MNKNEFLIDTDLLIDHLTTKAKISKLEFLMQKGNCFTTAINASELYYLAQDKKNKLHVDKLLRAIKVLGINSRYSLFVNEFSQTTENFRDALFSVVAMKNNLIICTSNKQKYLKTGIEILDPKEI